MSLLFMDSFDHYVFADILEKYTTSTVGGAGGTLTFSTAAGRRGSNGFRWTTGTGNTVLGAITKVLGSSNTTIIAGFSFNSSTSLSSVTPICQINNASVTILTLKLNTDMTVSVMRGGAAGVVLGTTSAGLAIGIHTYIEFKVLIANSGGTVDVRFNGVSVLSLTGLDTQQDTTANWTSISFGQSENSSNTNITPGRTFDYDDLYVCDGVGAAPWNGFIGDVRVDARLPTAPGATTGWTPLAGANWQNVDDAAPDDDTTYNSTATVGLTDTFVVQDAPVVGATILGIQHNISAKKSDAGTASIAPIIRHSGTDNPGTNQNPSTGYAYLTQIATEIAPGVPLTEANFNAAEFGYRKTV